MRAEHIVTAVDEADTFVDIMHIYLYIYIYLSCVLSTVFFTVLMNE